jgi:gag-polypeptide of LTR copia-type
MKHHKMSYPLQLKLRLDTLWGIGKVNGYLNENKLGVKVEDVDQFLLLLCSLPTSHKSFRDLMIYSRERITLDDVKSNLNNEMIDIEKGIIEYPKR